MIAQDLASTLVRYGTDSRETDRFHHISHNHAMVVIEVLQVRNMSTSAAGTVETPGRNVRAKSGLNKSILDQRWGEFRRQLDYKLAWGGEHLIAIPPRNTSRTCPACGYVSTENRQAQAQFACVKCEYKNHADLVDAINIVAAGHAVLACEGTAQSGRPMNRTPPKRLRLLMQPEHSRNPRHSCRGGCQRCHGCTENRHNGPSRLLAIRKQ